jgi:hypothetical protein
MTNLPDIIARQAKAIEELTAERDQLAADLEDSKRIYALESDLWGAERCTLMADLAKAEERCTLLEKECDSRGCDQLAAEKSRADALAGRVEGQLVTICVIDRDAPFVCEVHGKFDTGALSDIEQVFLDESPEVPENTECVVVRCEYERYHEDDGGDRWSLEIIEVRALRTDKD